MHFAVVNKSLNATVNLTILDVFYISLAAILFLKTWVLLLAGKL